MAHTQREYVPAAGKHWRLPFYDLVARLLGADGARRVLLEHAEIRPGERVLDIGCGTGTLAVEMARNPGVEVVGLDPDPGALAIARRKAERASVAVAFDQGFADALPYPDASFDHVTSSLMFHHLPRDAREPALREVRRVLKPGGRFHMLDFDGPSVGHGSFIARKIHGSKMMRDNAQARVLDCLRAAGLEDALVVATRDTWAASMAFYRARRPGA